MVKPIKRSKEENFEKFYNFALVKIFYCRAIWTLLKKLEIQDERGAERNTHA